MKAGEVRNLSLLVYSRLPNLAAWLERDLDAMGFVTRTYLESIHHLSLRRYAASTCGDLVLDLRIYPDNALALTTSTQVKRPTVSQY